MVHPRSLIIPAGLCRIPRQIAGFTEFRRAMLASIPRHPALTQWRARGDDDFGIMLIEMWAYVADGLAFYDETISHEAYLRTARRRPSLRKLTALLGYRPRPAVAATVTLAVLAEGRKPIVLPAGLAFRSSAFDDQAPQVFELENAATIHPLNNQWQLAAPVPPTLGSGGNLENFSQLLAARDCALKKDDLLLLRVGADDDHTQASTVTRIADIVAEDNQKYKELSFSPALSLPADTQPAAVEVKKATQSGSLWKITVSGNPAVIAKTQIILDGLYRGIGPGKYIILEKESEYRWFKVVENREVMMTISPAATTTVPDDNGTEVTVAVAAVTAPATQLVLDAGVNAISRKGKAADWNDADATRIIVHYGFVTGATVTRATQSTVATGDDLNVAGRMEAPADGTTPTAFLLEDKDQNGHALDATLNYSTGELTPGQESGWTIPLVMPVTLYGNVVTASRGETVTNEVLGSGNASLANQFFLLKKSPLTHSSAPTAENVQGVASSLKVYVDGILWQEAPSFHGLGPADRVYIVRQDDAGNSIVTFGDGLRGARLSTGIDNVTAIYRFGAGKAAPPAGGITQLAKPVKGLTAVKSPVAAAGGDDAQSAENLRKDAPPSALLLGRAVSMADMQAVAAGVAGVRAVTVEWRWNLVQQRPVIQVWYIGDKNIKTTVSQTLRSLSDPTTPIAVETALAISLSLAIDVEIDPRYLEDEVLPRLRAALMDSEAGLLAPERIGIGRPLYRSRVFAALQAVSGVSAVRGLLQNSGGIETPWSQYAIAPPAGGYFDVEQGGLFLNGKESDNG
jgi:predicted phage baseplate assembly protein